jgi:hypothetical protein
MIIINEVKPFLQQRIDKTSGWEPAILVSPVDFQNQKLHRRTIWNSAGNALNNYYRIV